MRKFYILVFGFCFGVGMTGQVINIPDANFKAKLIAASTSNTTARDSDGNFMLIDTDLDGEIQESEALLVRELIVDSSLISDLTGITYFINLTLLFCADNQISELDLSNFTNLKHLNCNDNNLGTLDISMTKIRYLNVKNNPLLTILILKNAFVNAGPPDPPGTAPPTSATYLNSYLGLQNLTFICTDEIETVQIKNIANANGYTCEVNSYCSFVPAGTYYTINGNNRLDLDNNGCDIADIPYPNFKFQITNGSVQSSIVPDFSGSYELFVGNGTHTISPVIENTNYFNVSPSVVNVSFPATATPATQDFCITPNGVHPDLEAIIIPLTVARPGFDSEYKIVYKNKGTETHNGTVDFVYPDDRMDLVASSPMPDQTVTDALIFNFTNLQPFETRVVTITMNLNSPVETPAVNGGDILYLSSEIHVTSDETPDDNTFDLNQTVVNSLDPNDKTCLEGTTIAPEMSGNYVHYMIRFENTGTANAENVVVKDMIDTAKFDVTSLIPLDGSHPFATRITANNKVEFIFENIQLPFDDENNDGFVAFKIKTLPTLTTGDSFSNTASIYFDYNFPIVTDPAVTTIQVLGREDLKFDNYFTLYPNPVSNILNIKLIQDIEVSSISVYNTLGQLVLVVPNTTATIDVSTLASGNYFMKVFSDKGSASARFVKE